MPATEEAVRLSVAAAAAADDVKATDLALLDVSDLLVIVDVFVLATAGSDRQLKAIGERIEERLRDHGRRPLRREGTPSAGWVLLDFGDLVCHLFLAEQRGLYALERLWADVPRRDVRTGEVVASDVDVAVAVGAGAAGGYGRSEGGDPAAAAPHGGSASA